MDINHSTEGLVYLEQIFNDAGWHAGVSYSPRHNKFYIQNTFKIRPEILNKRVSAGSVYFPKSFKGIPVVVA